MKKCPYCGAQLQQEASFCLYCMRSLESKQDVTPRLPKRRRSLLWIGAAALILVAAVILTLVLWQSTRGSEESSGTEAVTGQTPPSTQQSIPSTAQPAEPKLPITSYESFTDAALYADTSLWNPFSLTLLAQEDSWYELWVPVYLDGAQMQLYFLDDDSRIYSVFSGIKEEDLEKGSAIACELMSMICSDASSNYKEATPTMQRLQAFSPVAQEAFLANILPFEDPLGQQSDGQWVITGNTVYLQAKSQRHPEIYFTCQLRQRTWKGETYYDLFFFFGQE